MAVNAKGMWLVVKAFLPLLGRSEGAAVVNQNSIGAFIADPGYLSYTASKNAIIGINKTLAG
jgi:NAD(P)-dependent dehydrogenase (short-subunit alcohol dehydrogenase family)